jgi:hypothetical protein
MSRADSIGFFWDDTPAPKPPKKEKPKAIPPLRFWESPAYLPDLEEARAWQPNLYSDQELYQASQTRERLVYDIESYPNYALFAFKGIQSKKVVYFEVDNQPLGRTLDIPKLKWILENFLIVNFNGLSYDFPVTAVALAGYDSEALWVATDMIIAQQLREKEVYKKFKVKKLQVNQIDLIELTALAPGLKVCAGRLHAPKLQDLPFKPGTYLTEDQITILRRYCINDLDNTEILYNATIKQIELREQMSTRFHVDLRSHSDAQMAESIISAEVKRTTGRKFLKRTTLPPGTSYKFQVPTFIKYSTPLMNHILDIVRNATFEVDPFHGAIVMPPELAKLVIEMGNSKYKIGIGGLHSQEKSVAHVADEDYFIADTDATSYYPKLILNAGLAPENLGHDFLLVYNGIVVERISAKEAGNIIVAECLKIVANGTFGKLGSMWSIVYAPNLLIQVTVTGQLSILMLAERFELAGIEVTSINTDGIVVKCLRSKESEFNAIVKQWERDTGFITEEIRYKATYSRDINNYIAVYETPQKGKLFKLKGAYGPTAPKKNAVNEICVEAVKNFIATGKPLIETIAECRDITQFTTMRAVSGGAVKGDLVGLGEQVTSGVFLGKLIRWYYSSQVQGDIVYAKTGNKVALSEGARPCMNLPDTFPDDVDYLKYEAMATRILYDIGYLKKDEKEDESACHEEDEV